MPVEYAGAAYRFGHSMIRAEYEVQDGHTVADLRPGRLRGPARQPADPGEPVDRLELLLRHPGHGVPGRPEHVPADRHAALAAAVQAAVHGRRADGRARSSRWPSATCCAASGWACPPGRTSPSRWASSPLTNAQLGLTEPGWKDKAPLWFYILKESELLGGRKLGPVGGRIVAEVILGLMALDKTSYFNANPSFSPGPNYRMGDMILAADAIDPRARVKPADPEVPQDPAAPGGAGCAGGARRRCARGAHARPAAGRPGRSTPARCRPVDSASLTAPV